MTVQVVAQQHARGMPLLPVGCSILAAPSVDPLFGDLGCELRWALIFKQVKAGGSTNPGGGPAEKA